MTVEAYVSDYQGNWIAALPDAIVDDVTDTLNDSQAMNFRVPQDSPGSAEISGWDREIQLREIIPAEGVNEIVFQGPVVSEDGDQDIAKFACEGVLSHFGTRYVDRLSLLYTSIEQRTIALDLINYAQDVSVQANRGFSVVSSPWSGTTRIRSRNYKREEHANILDLLKEFPALDDGFDFDIVIQPDGARWWTPYYPKKGSTLTDVKLQYILGDAGNNCTFTYKRDWKRQITQCYATGGTNGDVKFESNYEDISMSANYGVRQGLVSEGSQLDVNWLLARATREVGERKRPLLVPTVTVHRDVRDYRRLIQTGDEVPLNIQRGRLSINQPRRVLQKKWNVQADTVDLVVAEQ